MTVNNQESTEALRELDEVGLYNDLQDSLTLKPNPDKRGYGHVHSTHLIDLYDAGYYAYMKYVPLLAAVSPLPLPLPLSTCEKSRRPSPNSTFLGTDAYPCSLSAHAFAEDFFETYFAQDPRSPEAWDRYRRGILEYGGSKNEMETMTDYLGREPGPDALLRSLGLKGEN